ncbi:interferon alpha/beta receptor 1a-like [Betta splendens]|uniref:Interferon alpha/beta receptor 1a-like n=1 Tax=Betta splendens TaxID=158456 RepID=A0A6P7LHF0_BETSP|nr:interferon alpha/beta receptor 1a-like [Betta splendens]
MSLVRIACLLLWYLQTVVVGEELAQPQDVTLITMNTNYTLSWDWPQRSADSPAVTFTTQYVGKYQLRNWKKSPNWSTVCNESPLKSCDLTAVGLHYLAMYVLRVRANTKERHSVWVHKEFCPDKDAALGPPVKVNLALDESNIEISISEPVTSANTPMRNIVPTLRYNVIYWERSADTQTKMLTTDTSLVYLPNLKAWTWYCVSIQSRYDFYNKSSILTPPQCIQTEGNILWWQIFLYFLASLAICFLVVLLSVFMSFWCYRIIKATFFPSDQLPQHLKKYLCSSPGSDVPGLLTPDQECELLCKSVSISAIPTVLEIFSPPPEALPTTSLEPNSRQSHEKSSTSRDSGVFSREGSTSVQQSSSSQFYRGAKDFGWSPFDLEQVSMQSMAPGLKCQPLNADEGIVDMCV